MVFAGHVHYHVQAKPEETEKKEQQQQQPPSLLGQLLSNFGAAIAGGLITFLLHRGKLYTLVTAMLSTDIPRLDFQFTRV